MWLSKKMAAQNGGGEGAVYGRVTAGQGAPTVQADGEYRALEVYAPAGIAALPNIGDSVLLTDAGGRKRLVGILSDTSGLQPGEIRLRSAGGAEIWLKNTGEVVVNGQLFSAVEEGEA